MAEFTSAEKVNIGYKNEYSTDAMTGGPDKRRQLYYQLIQSMKKAESVDIIVSFLMESGVRMLLKELEIEKCYIEEDPLFQHTINYEICNKKIWKKRTASIKFLQKELWETKSNAR